MRFVLYTDMTVPQCMRALNERMQAKPTKARPELQGWVEKKGAFSISLSSKVAGRFSRTTRLSAQAERESGVTIIRGYVSDGMSPVWLRVVMIIVGIVALGLLASGDPMLAVVIVLFAGLAYIPLRGDYVNSDLLLIEVERTLKATPKVPKKLRS